MRKVNLIMKEMDKYKVIKKLVETNGTKQRAAVTLEWSVRHINRMIKGYKAQGKDFFTHKNRGRKPVYIIQNANKGLEECRMVRLMLIANYLKCNSTIMNNILII